MPDKSWRTCEITQDCCYGWTPENVQKFIDGWSSVKDYAYILHDKDKKDDNTTPREPHIHLMLRFNNAIHTSAILARAKKVGIPADSITENRIQKMKSWSAALNYLTHRDEHKPWKHVYDTAEVQSNFDWQLESESAHQAKQLRADKGREKEIVDMICSGEIREYMLSDYIEPYEEVMYNKAINTAFARVTREMQQETDREMQVIFISGSSGSGKDTFAISLCESEGKEYYRCSTGNNPFDDYKGQPVIIWSDARDSSMKAQDVLALLDNHYACSQGARYKNKSLITCEVFIITSIKDIHEWYKNAFSKQNEDRRQLYRRVLTWFSVEDDKIYQKIYDESKGDYVGYNSFPNKYRHQGSHLDTEEKRTQYAINSFGSEEYMSSYDIQEVFDEPGAKSLRFQKAMHTALNSFFGVNKYE